MADINKLFPKEETRKIVESVIKTSTTVLEAHNTNYDILDKSLKVLKDVRSAACYAALPNYCKEHKDKLRFVRIIQTPSIIQAEEGIRWIQLCQGSGAIGNTLQYAEDIFYRGLLIDLMNPYWSTDRLYVALCNYRFLREGVTLIRNIIKLVDHANVPFWQAFVFCHGHNISAFGHSWLPWGNTPYASGTGLGSGKNNLWLVKHLVDYFDKKSIKPKTDHFYSVIVAGTRPIWSISKLMVAESQIQVKERVKMLTEKATLALCASSKQEAERIFNE